MKIDTSQRADALDPGQSFIVEAPAGSGKTELLIQRYLGLLARVERPEQIVAITFTRKAAAEMRERIIETLRAAASAEPDVPAHREASLRLAKAALARSESLGWSLIQHPRRLSIMTIDSLNSGLAQRLPVQANGVASLGITDDVSRLYARAASRITEGLSEADAQGGALRQLLFAADNSLLRLERLLAGTLSQRDRWLRAFLQESDEPLANQVKRSLEQLPGVRIAAIREVVAPADEASLVELLAQRSQNMAESDAGDTGDDAAVWREAAGLLLTADGGWRKRFTRREGFPADDAALRSLLDEVLERLKASPGLRERLAALRELPPVELSGAQRDQLAALAIVLPRLLAELRVLFVEAGTVDHTELALAAQQALGASDEPSELLLALDRRIEHILVDEFQDTSHLQWNLLELLTAGWQEGDGRTLFLVGDPMQSIYRFRDADVSLFMKARREGLGSVRLRPLELVENHRSAAGIVDWVNAAFSRIFPADTGSDAGLVAYRRAVSEQAQDDSAGVALHVLGDEGYAAETARVVALVRSELDSAPEQSIGILVRSRSHLAGLRSALAEAGFPAHAIEIDSLADTQLGQDLIGMTQALLHPGDRLAWFGVLRSPWCGLDWADLLALAQALGERTVIEAIADPASLTGVSEEGSERLSWIAERLGRARAMRQELPLGRWLRHCWLAIDGPATLADASGLETAERFFIDVEAYARNGDIDDPAGLREVFGEPAAGNEVPAESGIEIMTMHRAKGLEFDTVILPGLGRITRGSQSNLLLCKDFLLPDHSRLGLLAAACGTSDPLFDYLRASERADDASERGRLLYVAATRARHRLHLIGSLDAERGVPRSGSLLATLWPGLAETPVPEAGASAQTEPEPLFRQIPLRRLALEGAPPAPASIRAEPAPVRPEFEWVHPASVQVGTLIHHELQRAAEAAALTGEAVAPSADPESSRRQLALLGVEEPDLAAAARRVAEALERVWEDPVGRWILQPRKETWSELKLTINNGKQLEHIQLDRSFVDEDGVRWIIDYKTGRHLGGDVEAFLDSEVERYRDQLERYADAVAETDQRPLRVGLYFPLMANLRDWQPAAAAGR